MMELEHTRNARGFSFARLAGIIFTLCSNLSETLKISSEIPPAPSITDIAEILLRLFSWGGGQGHTGTPKIIKSPNL